MQSNLRRNPLAYPSGVAPGVDLTHPAAKNIMHPGSCVAVPLGGGFIDILQYRTATNTSVTQNIDAALSAAPSFGGSSIASFTQGSYGAPAQRTYGAIVRFSSISAGFQFIVGVVGGVGDLWGLNSGALGIYQSGAFQSSGVSLSANIPYFIATSSLPATSNANYAVANLATGAVNTFSAFTAGACTASTGQAFTVGNNNGFGQGLNGSLAALMCNAGVYLSISQLRQWASDPWSFWYPQPARSRVAVPVAGGSFIPAWAMNSNLPVIGTGTY